MTSNNKKYLLIFSFVLLASFFIMQIGAVYGAPGDSCESQCFSGSAGCKSCCDSAGCDDAIADEDAPGCDSPNNWGCYCGGCSGCNSDSDCYTADSCCDNECIDTDHNEDHCGECYNSCSSGETCCYGTCADLNTDENNCGRCIHRCAAGETCEDGECVITCTNDCNLDDYPQCDGDKIETCEMQDDGCNDIIEVNCGEGETCEEIYSVEEFSSIEGHDNPRANCDNDEDTKDCSIEELEEELSPGDTVYDWYEQTAVDIYYIGGHDNPRANCDNNPDTEDCSIIEIKNELNLGEIAYDWYCDYFFLGICTAVKQKKYKLTIKDKQDKYTKKIERVQCVETTTCEDDCNLDDYPQCDGDTSQKCVEQDDDGCNDIIEVDCNEFDECETDGDVYKYCKDGENGDVWGAYDFKDYYCDLDSVHFSGGTCNYTYKDDYTEEDGRCDSELLEECGPNEICENGECVAECEDECNLDDYPRCDGDTSQKCVEQDDDGCNDIIEVNCNDSDECVTSGDKCEYCDFGARWESYDYWNSSCSDGSCYYDIQTKNNGCQKVKIQDCQGNGCLSDSCNSTCIPNASMSCSKTNCGGENCSIAYQSTSDEKTCSYTLKNNSTDPDGDEDIIKSRWYVKEEGGNYSLIESFVGIESYTLQPIRSPGYYTFKLEVEDEYGAVDSTTQSIEIKKEILADFECSLAPNSNWKSCEEIEVTTGETLFFKDISELSKGAENIISWKWEKEGEVFSDNSIASTTIDKKDTTIKLIVEDNNGRKDSKEYSITPTLSLPDWEETRP